MTAQDIAVVLLAAGRAKRFGSEKLTADLGGRALCHHAAATLAKLPFGCRTAVVESEDMGLGQFGFEIERTGPHNRAMSRSIALGVSAAVRHFPGLRGVLLCLADAPFVPAVHFERLIERFDDDLVASASLGIAQTPAIFGTCHIERLVRLEGDTGAKSLLGQAQLVEARPEWLQDIDTVGDIQQARESLIRAVDQLP